MDSIVCQGSVNIELPLTHKKNVLSLVYDYTKESTKSDAETIQ